MAPTIAAKVIHRVRKRLQLSQEGLSRLLNATKGAVQHWERGRNNPDSARLWALRELCPPGPERKDVEALIRQAQGRIAPVTVGREGLIAAAGAAGRRAARFLPEPSGQGLSLLRRDNLRLRRLVEKLRATLERKDARLRILEDVAKELQRETAALRAGQSEETSVPQFSPRRHT